MAYQHPNRINISGYFLDNDMIYVVANKAVRTFSIEDKIQAKRALQKSPPLFRHYTWMQKNLIRIILLSCIFIVVVIWVIFHYRKPLLKYLKSWRFKEK